MIGVFAAAIIVVAGLRTRPITDRDLFQFAIYVPILIAVLLLGVMFGVEGLWRAATGTATKWITKLFSYAALALFLMNLLVRIAAHLYLN